MDLKSANFLRRMQIKQKEISDQRIKKLPPWVKARLLATRSVVKKYSWKYFPTLDL